MKKTIHERRFAVRSEISLSQIALCIHTKVLVLVRNAVLTMAESFRSGLFPCRHFQSRIENLLADLNNACFTGHNASRIHIHVPRHSSVCSGIAADLQDGRYNAPDDTSASGREQDHMSSARDQIEDSLRIVGVAVSEEEGRRIGN